MTSFTVETIPDPDRLFYRIHKTYCRDGALQPNAFHDIGGGMSVDWAKHSTASQSQARAKNPLDNGIVSFTAIYLRQLFQQVTHKPSPQNQAHSEVIGTKDVEFRVRLAREKVWEIKVANLNCD